MAARRKKTPTAARRRKVEALILDCDGVLTNGEITYDEQGKRSLNFYARDGLGLALLRRSGVEVAVLSGRPVDIAELRHRELGVTHFVGPCSNKSKAIVELAESLDVALDACAFVGDDLADLGAMKRCGLAIAVADATAEVRRAAHWVTLAPGGRGAVREVCEGLLRARGEWRAIVSRIAGTD